jgi:ribulose-phosphate 3-epimerase
MTEVVPAIIPYKFADIEKKVAQVCGMVSRVQVDIVDGVFAPSKTWPFVGDFGEFSKLVLGTFKLPYLGEIKYSLDMMVAHPRAMLDDWISAGFSAFIIHRESVTTDAMLDIAKYLHGKGLKVGIALRPRNPVEEIAQYLKYFDFVQFMGNDRIGYHGVLLDEAVLGKIRGLRQTHPRITINVDIGVNTNTAPKLVSAGADRLVSGSAVFDSEDIRKTIKVFESLE